jgi:hypothetical protein
MSAASSASSASSAPQAAPAVQYPVEIVKEADGTETARVCALTCLRMGKGPAFSNSPIAAVCEEYMRLAAIENPVLHSTNRKVSGLYVNGDVLLNLTHKEQVALMRELESLSASPLALDHEMRQCRCTGSGRIQACRAVCYTQQSHPLCHQPHQ